MRVNVEMAIDSNGLIGAGLKVQFRAYHSSRPDDWDIPVGKDMGPTTNPFSRLSYTRQRDNSITHVTWCGVYLYSGATHRLLTEGASFCTKDDVFDKWLGRKLALTNALKDAYLGLDVVKALWAGYLAGTPVGRANRKDRLKEAATIVNGMNDGAMSVAGVKDIFRWIISGGRGPQLMVHHAGDPEASPVPDLQ